VKHPDLSVIVPMSRLKSRLMATRMMAEQESDIGIGGKVVEEANNMVMTTYSEEIHLNVVDMDDNNTDTVVPSESVGKEEPETCENNLPVKASQLVKEPKNSSEKRGDIKTRSRTGTTTTGGVGSKNKKKKKATDNLEAVESPALPLPIKLFTDIGIQTVEEIVETKDNKIKPLVIESMDVISEAEVSSTPVSVSVLPSEPSQIEESLSKDTSDAADPREVLFHCQKEMSRLKIGSKEALKSIYRNIESVQSLIGISSMNSKTVNRTRRYLTKYDVGADLNSILLLRELGSIDSMTDIEFMPLTSPLNRTVLLLPKWRDDISKRCQESVSRISAERDDAIDKVRQDSIW